MKTTLIAALALAASGAVPAQAQEAKATTRTSLAWMSLDVADIGRASRFYSEALGMKQALVLSKPDDPFQKIGFNFSGNPAAPEPLLILIHFDTPPPGGNETKGAKLGLIVPDLRVATAQVRRAGYPILREPPADATGAILTAIVRDPDGTVVELTQLNGLVTAK